MNNCIYTNKYTYSYKAFTLAEVLITLVIIGVIAAISIPTLMTTTEHQQYVTGLKKAFSVLKQSMYTISANNGYPQGDYSFYEDENFLDEFCKVANVIKKCNSTNECFGDGSKNYTLEYKQLNNNNATNFSSGKAVITADGAMYTFTTPSGTYGLTDEDVKNRVGRIVVDVNGQRKPNKYGYDTFFFYIIDGKGVIPAGQHSQYDCNKNSSGVTCAAKVLNEGRIKYN